jgi:hypothetical protein
MRIIAFVTEAAPVERMLAAGPEGVEPPQIDRANICLKRRQGPGLIPGLAFCQSCHLPTPNQAKGKS